MRKEINRRQLWENQKLIEGLVIAAVVLVPLAYIIHSDLSFGSLIHEGIKNLTNISFSFADIPHGQGLIPDLASGVDVGDPVGFLTSPKLSEISKSLSSMVPPKNAISNFAQSLFAPINR